MPLTDQERRLRARLAVHAKWAQTDPHEGTAAARANGPGSIDYWLRQLPPEAAHLPEAERVRRAGHLKSAYYTRLALRSAQARRKGGAHAAS